MTNDVFFHNDKLSFNLEKVDAFHSNDRTFLGREAFWAEGMGFLIACPGRGRSLVPLRRPIDLGRSVPALKLCCLTIMSEIAPDAAFYVFFFGRHPTYFNSEVNGINMNHCLDTVNGLVSTMYETLGHEVTYSLQIRAAKGSVKHQKPTRIEVQIWKSIKSYQPQPSAP